MSKHEKFTEIIRNGAQLLQEELDKGSKFYCISHLDADGVTGAAVLTKVIESHNGQINYKFTHSLRNDLIDSTADNQKPIDCLIFCDCGSTSLNYILSKFPNKCILVIDHHKTAQDIPSNKKVETTSILTATSAGIITIELFKPSNLLCEVILWTLFS